MQLEGFEGKLRQFSKNAVTWPVWGFGLNEPTSLMFIPKPEATMKRRYWLPGLGSPI